MMVSDDELRVGEVAVVPPPPGVAGLVYIGRIRTPWPSRRETPHRGHLDGPICRLEIFELWAPALSGVEQYPSLEVIYWLHLSRRDLVRQSPGRDGSGRGTFSLRSPVRPNPIGTASVNVVGIEGSTVLVRGLDCVDGTPLIDLKPDRSMFKPRNVET